MVHHGVGSGIILLRPKRHLQGAKGAEHIDEHDPPEALV